jgi:hypothetical protein
MATTSHFGKQVFRAERLPGLQQGAPIENFVPMWAPRAPNLQSFEKAHTMCVLRVQQALSVVDFPQIAKIRTCEKGLFGGSPSSALQQNPPLHNCIQALISTKDFVAAKRNSPRAGQKSTKKSRSVTAPKNVGPICLDSECTKNMQNRKKKKKKKKKNRRCDRFLGRARCPQKQTHKRHAGGNKTKIP